MQNKKINKFYNDIKAFKVLDYTLQIGLIFAALAIITAICDSIMIDRRHTTPVIMLILVFCGGLNLHKFFKKNETAIIELKFAGDINQLVLKMIAEGGLYLKGKIGEYYTFGSNNKIMPNVEYTVRDCNDYCIVIAPELQLHSINKILQIQPLSTEVK